MITFLPQNDPEQRMILRRFVIAAGAYALWLGIGLLSLASGKFMIPDGVVPLIVVGVIATNIYFYCFIRSGLNKRLPDPSLAVSQIIVAMSWILVLIFSGTETRSLFLCVYVVTLMFGIFHLDQRRLMIVSAFALAGYVTVVSIDFLYFPQRFDAWTEALNLSVLTAMLFLLTMFGGHISALRNQLRRRNDELFAAVEEIGKVARRDDLTKAYNRRYIMEALEHQRAAANRKKRPFAVVILDLDHFKTINDRYGHLNGDRVLMAFAERVRGALRGMDLVDPNEGVRSFGRYGGEEFIIVLPDTPLSGALRCAERIREVTEETAFDDVLRVTISAGVAQYRFDESIEDLLRRADTALYEAKDRGRNRVVGAADTAIEADYEEDVLSQSNVIAVGFPR